MKNTLKTLSISWDISLRLLTVTDKKNKVSCITLFRSESKLIDLITESETQAIKDSKWETFNWISQRSFCDYPDFGVTIFRMYSN